MNLAISKIAGLVFYGIATLLGASGAPAPETTITVAAGTTAMVPV